MRDAKQLDLGTALLLADISIGRHFEEESSLDAQSEKTSDYNYYDHYADDVEDVHLVCSSCNPA